MSELATTSAPAKDEKLVYTAKTHTTGGRDGTSRSSDDRLDIKLSIPGAPGTGTNPEQLFAAGWSACFEGAMAVVARKRKIRLPADTAHRCRSGPEPDLGGRHLLPPCPPQRQPAGCGPGFGAGHRKRSRPDIRQNGVALLGEWRSLVAHSAGGRAVAGSNPVSPDPLEPAVVAGSAYSCHRPPVAGHRVDHTLEASLLSREISSYVDESDIPMGSPGGYWTGEGLGGDVVSRRSDALRDVCTKRNRATTRER